MDHQSIGVDDLQGRAVRQHYRCYLSSYIIMQGEKYICENALQLKHANNKSQITRSFIFRKALTFLPPRTAPMAGAAINNVDATIAAMATEFEKNFIVDRMYVFDNYYFQKTSIQLKSSFVEKMIEKKVRGGM